MHRMIRSQGKQTLPSSNVQICVVNATAYDASFPEWGQLLEGGNDISDEIKACALLLNNKVSRSMQPCYWSKSPCAPHLGPIPRITKHCVSQWWKACWIVAQTHACLCWYFLVFIQTFMRTWSGIKQAMFVNLRIYNQSIMESGCSEEKWMALI